jgi:hypothetical protein
MKPDVAEHGPFLIKTRDIEPAGFNCRICHQPVKVARQSFPFVLARVCAFACRCGPGVIVFEDEQQPNRRNWPGTMKLAQKAGADLLIYNGNQPTPPGFAGLN